MCEEKQKKRQTR